MGILLIVGIIGLFGLIIFRGPMKHSAAIQQESGACPGGNIKTNGGQIRSFTIDKSLIFLTLDFPKQNISKLVVYDYCQGKIITTIEAAK